ncbi:PIF1-like helicase domain-containing protein [Ditylenchus destructor]|uniref:PIF1-like helicase domain-containing protein n=1 Tax=Ditylenchus destructor TaxID=166010 RepID=A0AAD4MHX6_9BILA|nr:PIF1-like helicase domain-containing protein [Ditylenchus destructor]
MGGIPSWTRLFLEVPGVRHLSSLVILICPINCTKDPGPQHDGRNSLVDPTLLGSPRPRTSTYCEEFPRGPDSSWKSQVFVIYQIRFQVIPRCPMPPKRLKPQVPMETRSRAKAKNNAEIQPEVDAKRIRKDSRPVPVEDGSALRNDYKGEVPAKPQNVYGEGPCNPPARGKADVPHDKSYVGEGPSNPPGRGKPDEPHELLNLQDSPSIPLNHGNGNFLSDSDENFAFTIENAIQVLNEMYDKWLNDNSRSSTADTSIKAFTAHCNLTDPDLFINLSSNANTNSVALIDAFENGIALNEITTNNDLSNVADSLDEIDISVDSISNESVSKSRGDQKENALNRRSIETPVQKEKRLSAQKEYDSQRRSIETPVQKEKRLSAKRRRDMNTKNRTNEMSNLLAKERDPTKDYTFKLGSFDFPCVHCGALHFKNEANQNELKKNKAERSYDDCCSHGKIIYEDTPPFPNVLKSLFLKQHPRANEFIENIRNINASFGFVSINAHVKNLRGQYHYRIQGPLYHLFNHKAHPIPGTLPSYGQLFFLDTNQASDIRANNPLNARVSQELFREIETELRNSNNQLIKSYQMMYEVEKQQNELARRNNIPEKKVTLVFDRKARTRNDLPPAESNEVAAIYVTNSEGEVPRSYVTVYQTSGSISQFSTLSEFLDPMTYPLIYPRGETENQQTISWTDKDTETTIQEKLNKDTHLTAFFKLCKDSIHSEFAKRFCYWQVPEYFIWDDTNKNWNAAVKGERGEPITSIYGMPEPDMTLNDIAMNIDNVQHKEIAETMVDAMNEKQKQFFEMLTQNQRVDPDEIEFLETLKQLGDGELQDGDEGYFEFPEECLSNDLITDVYGSALATKNYDEMHERVILTPLNKDANEICNQVLEFLEGEDKYYTSMDTLAENNHLSNTERYPTEVLNAIQLNDFLSIFQLQYVASGTFNFIPGNAIFYQTSARQVHAITRVRLWGSFERLILGSSLHQILSNYCLHSIRWLLSPSTYG